VSNPAPAVPGAVGSSVLRVEDQTLLTGAAVFIDDISLPEMLHVAFCRSPIAHGRLLGIELAAARAAEGVEGVFVAADLGLAPLVTPIGTPDAYCPPRPLLAERAVCFAGEPVAVVVASSRYAAEDAAELVELELEPLEALVDPTRALEESAPRIHDEPSNVYMEARREAGDVDAAFAQAAVVVERVLRHGRVSAMPIEPRALVAAPENEGLRIWASTQGPHKLALVVSQLLGLERSQVRVLCTDVDGGFGQKAHVYPEEVVVAWLARRLGRPVKWIEDRAENLAAASHARDQHLRVRAAADAGGRLLALDVDQIADQGAYGSHPHGVTLEAQTTSGLVPGPYRVPAYRLHSRAVATNKCPEGAYRGVGFTVAVWAHERIMDVLAAELGLDRAEIRRRNLIAPDELPFVSVTNQHYDSGDYPQALELALEAIGYDRFETEREAARAEGRLLGLGISCYVEPTGMGSNVFKARGMIGIEGYDGAHVSLDSQGRATVWLTTPAIGQGTDTTFAQLVADALQLPLEDVAVALADTGVGGIDGTGTFASRSALSGGGALAGASAVLRRRLLEDAGEWLEVAAADLQISDGVISVIGSPASAVSVRELAAEAEPGRYAASETYDPPSVGYSYATHACIVEVDPETGAVNVRRYVVAEDCGMPINPMIVDGQVQGGAAQGIGESLYEAVVYGEDGQILTTSLMDYLVPTAGEVPWFCVEHLQTPQPDSAWGVKGVGEGGTVGSPGAIANAVADAVGADLNELPLSPELVRAAARGAASATRTA
jgi:aerobic carbon-monoxide dehydrogenase large subunit